MNGGDLNEISQAIGALQADMREGIRQREDTNRKLDNITLSLSKLTSLADDVAEMKPAVADWMATKQRGLGYLAGAGIGGAGIATGFHAVLKKWGLL